MSRVITVKQALNEAMREEMRRDETVIIMGCDVGIRGNPFGVTRGLYDEFGAERVRDTPISEAGFTGACLGAAATGLRPIAEILYSDWITIPMDQIVNQIAKIRYMFGGTIEVPLVIRAPVGAGGGPEGGPPHGRRPEPVLPRRRRRACRGAVCRRLTRCASDIFWMPHARPWPLTPTGHAPTWEENTPSPLAGEG